MIRERTTKMQANLGANNAQYFLFVVAIFNFETKERVVGRSSHLNFGS